MVSDVDATVAGVEQGRAERPTDEARAARARPAPQPQPEIKSEHSRESAGSSIGYWLIGIGAVIGLIFALSQPGNKNTSSAPERYLSAPPPLSTAQPQHAPARSLAAGRPSEEKPPLGKNNVLTVAQIRYCLAEEIRLDAAKGALDNDAESEVERFNAMVTDYNGRCGQFRYRQGSLESARSEVEDYLSVLRSEGRSRFRAGPAAGARQAAPETSRKQPDATVQAIQRGLNQLGYDAGPADGLAGAKTRAAIAAFQRDQNIPADGMPSSAVLQRLNMTAQRRL